MPLSLADKSMNGVSPFQYYREAPALISLIFKVVALLLLPKFFGALKSVSVKAMPNKEGFFCPGTKPFFLFFCASATLAITVQPRRINSFCFIFFRLMAGVYSAPMFCAKPME